MRRAENEEIRKRQNHSKKLIPNTQPSPDIRALLLQFPGCHAFCKKNSKKSARQPSASTRRRSEVNRCSVIAANRPAGVPARRISRKSPAPPRKGRAPSIPLRRRAPPCSCFLPQTNHKKTPIHQTETRPERGSQATAAILPAALSCCLPGKNSKQPAKALPPSITAIYPVCHAACKKTASAPPARMKRR